MLPWIRRSMLSSDPPAAIKPRPPLTGYTTYVQDIHIDLCIGQPSHFVPLRNGLYSFRAQTDYPHPVDHGTSYTALLREVADLYLS